MIRDKKWILGAYVYVFLFDISFLSHLGILEISIFIKNQESGPLVDIKSKFDYFFVSAQFIRWQKSKSWMMTTE